jgi:hypothetical protein
VQEEHPSHSAALPDRFALHGLQLEQDARPTNPQTVYTVRATVHAHSAGAAVTEVAGWAEEVAWLFATWNGSYRVDAGAGTATERPDPGAPAQTGPITRTRDVALRATLAEPRTTEFEARALAHRASWPTWLAPCLELNYLAVTSHDVRSALVIQWSILEELARQHVPAAKVLAQLDARRRQNFLSAVRRVLALVLDDGAVERLVSQLANTAARSTSDRIYEALAALGVHAHVDDVDRVWVCRGRIAHGASGAADEDGPGRSRHSEPRSSRFSTEPARLTERSVSR